MIEIKQLKYAYPVGEGQESQTVLDGVDLQIEKGSFTAILGHNGCGKSTLAKLLCAVLLPTDGEVLIDGLTTKEEQNILQIRRRVGMVFQNPDNQIVANVVEEDVAFAPENLGIPAAEIRKRVDEALAAVGMEEFRLHAPHLLRGGKKQRIAIAGVLAMEPEVLVLDEVTAMLDPEGRREVLDTVHRLNRERGMTVLLITHHMSEVEQADRVIVMEQGKVVMDGKPKEIFPRVEELRGLALDVPGTVDLLYELRRRGWDVPLDALSVEECADAVCRILQ